MSTYLDTLAQNAVLALEPQHSPFWNQIPRFPAIEPVFWATHSDTKSLESLKKRGLSIGANMLNELLDETEFYRGERDIVERVLYSPLTIGHLLKLSGDDPNELHPWPEDAGPRPGILASWAIYIGANVAQSTGNTGYLRLRPRIERAFSFLAQTIQVAIRPAISEMQEKDRKYRPPATNLATSSDDDLGDHFMQGTTYTTGDSAIPQQPIFSFKRRPNTGSSPLASKSTGLTSLPSSDLGVFACALPDVPLPPPKSVFPLPPTPSPPKLGDISRLPLHQRIARASAYVQGEMRTIPKSPLQTPRKPVITQKTAPRTMPTRRINKQTPFQSHRRKQSSPATGANLTPLGERLAIQNENECDSEEDVPPSPKRRHSLSSRISPWLGLRLRLGITTSNSRCCVAGIRGQHHRR
uniref:Uncharacterized protein n=1 Tax=Mycena chlorophos TaxID=658473 RepID=A0ABQ0L3L4_MYCCL|nr:predicted protein [Mycena chlorophos]